MGLLDEYNQKPGETYDDWKYRIILGKSNGTIKLSWNEITDLLGMKCHGEHLRKVGSGISEYDRYIKEKSATSVNAGRQMRINELESAMFSEQKERMRMQDQGRELRNTVREWARAEHIQDELSKAIKNAVKNTPKYTTTLQKIVTPTDNEAVLLLSDWHKGQNTINFLNTYNDAVFRERIKNLIQKTTEYGNTHQIKALNLFVLGDLINGLIHVTTRITNTENVIQQTMDVAETLSSMIFTFSEVFPQVNVYFARGNHDRVTPNSKESLTKESFFDIIPWYVAARFDGMIDNIKLIENKLDSEIITTKICGHEIFAVHGHRDKMNNVIQNLSSMIKEFPEYVFMGHYHHSAENEIAGGEVITNSSLCGVDEYAINIRKVAKPGQKLMIFNSEGRLCTYDIKL